MTDLRYFNALFDEFQAEPATLFRRDKDPVDVIVRGFTEGGEGIRLVIQAREGLDEQLILPREGLRRLRGGPQTMEAYLLPAPREEPVALLVSGLHDGEGVRLTIGEGHPLEQQLLIHRNAAQRLADDPQDMPDA